MRKPIRFLPVLGLVVASTTLVGPPAFAVPITYTETDTATGSLNGVAFTDANIVLTMNNNTTNVTGGPTLFDNVGTVTVQVGAGAPVTFTDSRLQGLALHLHPVQQNSSDPATKQSAFNSKAGAVTVPALTTAVFVAEKE